MGIRRLYKIEWLHMLGASESERLKVAALNLFHPTASPPSAKVSFFIAAQPLNGGRAACLPVGRGVGGAEDAFPVRYSEYGLHGGF
jgi:hypothetical protein